MRLKVTYLAHDLDDPSIWRRVAMLQSGGAEVNVAGFRRGTGPVQGTALVLGSTTDGQMLRRAGAVMAALPVIRARLQDLGAADVVLARNLEMLTLGAAARGRAALVYELLDVHHLMLGNGLASRVLRAMEARLMRRSSAVMISSPGFERNYLRPFDRPRLPSLLVENKLLPASAESDAEATGSGAQPRQVIRIGWFGMLRCRWSLQTLDSLTRGAPGRYQVILRGRPSRDQIPDFDAVIDANPDMCFGGPYRWPDELSDIYHDVDLVWMIDRYQAGGNSDWLLPNRLYEGGRHGAVPLALEGTEMAHKLRSLGVGVVVADTSVAVIGEHLAAMAHGRLATLKAAVAALPRTTWEASRADCEDLVARLGDLRHASLSPITGDAQAIAGRRR